MLTLTPAPQRLHPATPELIDAQMMPCHERPQRAEKVLARVREVGLGEVLEPQAFGLDPVRRVHDAGFVDFLATAWADWAAEGRSNDALPLVWPVPGLRHDRVPENIDGRLGFYSMDAGVPITAGTWGAVQSSADTALTAARAVASGTPCAFALCRPPGHHAGAASMGGYCYLNNAAIAAQYLLDQGGSRVVVLDVDYHHGNGTQSIFYSRDDVLFVSLHADPTVEYPFFLGHADERGAGAGAGYNLNYPLPFGTAWDAWGAALDDACAHISAHGPDAVVVSLGVDTYAGDPISKFELVADDFSRMGRRIAALGRPTLFVLEGGYAVDDIGANTVNVLTGFEEER
jgi:acetoin utilization deacetylase AcuC-like enzyme